MHRSPYIYIYIFSKIYRYMTENTPENAWESGNACYAIYLSICIHTYIPFSPPRVSLYMYIYLHVYIYKYIDM